MIRVDPPGGAKAVAGRSALLGALTFGVALLLFVGVGGLRIWPRISGQHLPFSLIWPFARPLFAAALELSFLVSVPVALGWFSRTAPSPGPWRDSALATLVLLGCLGCLSFGLSASLDPKSTSPGQLATELVAAARESCLKSAPPAQVTAPLVGLSWSCESGRAPRVHGHAPLGKQAEFSADSIELGADLKRISLAHFALSFSTPSFPIQIHAGHAVLRGLPPWGRSRRMPLTLRFCLFVLSAGLAAYGVGRLVARRPWLPAWAGPLLGAPVSGCLWFALSWLERQEPRRLTYVVLPAAGIVGLLALAVGLGLGRRIWLRWRQSSVIAP